MERKLAYYVAFYPIARAKPQRGDGRSRKWMQPDAELKKRGQFLYARCRARRSLVTSFGNKIPREFRATINPRDDTCARKGRTPDQSRSAPAYRNFSPAIFVHREFNRNAWTRFNNIARSND